MEDAPASTRKRGDMLVLEGLINHPAALAALMGAAESSTGAVPDKVKVPEAGKVSKS